MNYYPKGMLDMDPKNVMPDIMEAPLAGIIWQGEFNYYAAPRMLWYLDFQKLLNDSRSGTTHCISPELLAHRFGVLIADDMNKEAYLKGLEPYKRSCQELQDAMRMCIQDDELDDFVVQLLIDFDKNHLVSHCSEPFFFEEYVPDDWTSEYRAFRSDDIPQSCRFWYASDDENLFECLFKENL